jgi:hypothetical protein
MPFGQAEFVLEMGEDQVADLFAQQPVRQAAQRLPD